LPRYNPDVVGLEVLTEGPPRVGSRYRFRVQLQRFVRVPTTLTIREVDAPRRLVFEMESLMRAREVGTFESVGDETHVHFETRVDTPGFRLAKNLMDRLFVVPNARRQMQGELERMKQQLED